MSDRSVLITGCSSGIGRAAAETMRARGWRVFATARTGSDLEDLRAAGFEAIALDYIEPVAIAACAEAVLDATNGRLTALFNNGAYGQPGAVEDLRTDVLRAQFEANFFGWHDLTTRLIPAMRAAKTGRIVQCSSVLGLAAMRYRGAYVASKFALEGLTDAMRLELAGSGIFVSSIEPGPIATRFVEHALAAFRANIDAENSPHRAVYATRMAKMGRGGSTAFKLPAEAVAQKLVHGLESSRPKPHYYVTTATHMVAAARRLLPARLMDAFILKVDG